VVEGHETTVAALCDDYFIRKADWSEANQDTVRAVLELIKTAIDGMEVATVEPWAEGASHSLPLKLTGRWERYQPALACPPRCSEGKVPKFTNPRVL
jgi:hypothetical protein